MTSAIESSDLPPSHHVLPYFAARRLVVELLARGVRCELLASSRTCAWVAVWGGLTTTCNGNGFTWINGNRGSQPVYASVPADDPVTAATRIAARHDVLAAQHPTHRLAEAVYGAEAVKPQ